MKMKLNRLTAFLCICILTALTLAGCGDGNKNSGTPNNSGNVSTDNKGGKGYVFKAKGVEISVDMDMSTIEEKLGETVSYFEEPSCAAQGTARLFTYSGFEIDTYPDGEKDLVGYIILKDDTVATPEGIDLSKTKADVIKAYGEDYKENGTALVYERGGMKLSFIMDGDNISSIQYSSSVMD